MIPSVSIEMCAGDSSNSSHETNLIKGPPDFHIISCLFQHSTDPKLNRQGIKRKHVEQINVDNFGINESCNACHSDGTHRRVEAYQYNKRCSIDGKVDSFDTVNTDHSLLHALRGTNHIYALSGPPESPLGFHIGNNVRASAHLNELTTVEDAPT